MAEMPPSSSGESMSLMALSFSTQCFAIDLGSSLPLGTFETGQPNFEVQYTCGSNPDSYSADRFDKN